MSISPAREEQRLKATLKALASSPEDPVLLSKKLGQEIALKRQEEAYPKLLMSHLKKCANNGQVDAKGRTKKQAKDLLAGIPIPAKAGTGNG
jgi:hypothetical protein